MFTRLCFWKPRNSRHNFTILCASSEDKDGLTLQSEGYEAMHQWERESLSYLYKESSESVGGSSLTQSSAIVQASWNEIECTHSTSASTEDDSLGSLVTATTRSQLSSVTEAQSLPSTELRSIPSTELTVSFDENHRYVQLSMFSRDADSANESTSHDDSKAEEADSSCLSNDETDSEYMGDDIVGLYENTNPQDAYKREEESNDGYNADNDEYSYEVENVDHGDSGVLGVSYPHPAQFRSDGESIAWRSDETEMTRILQKYDTMCCAGNEPAGDESSASSSVWSDIQ